MFISSRVCDEPDVFGDSLSCIVSETPDYIEFRHVHAWLALQDRYASVAEPDNIRDSWASSRN
ncbi:hypothetical protein M413DRAFT_440678, partial [Hebeloma cylindrosporum]